LNQLNLNFNVGVFIIGIEQCWHQNELENFVYVLRSAYSYIPEWLKFVCSVELSLDNT